jgi:hypothetical protein
MPGCSAPQGAPQYLRVAAYVKALALIVLLLVAGCGESQRSFCEDEIASGSYGASFLGEEEAMSRCMDTSYIP